jgi:deoxyribodipyrimidine photo-lyase
MMPVGLILKLHFSNFYKSDFDFPILEQIGFEEAHQSKPHNLKFIADYQDIRDYPALDQTYLSPHLRFVWLAAFVN